MKPGSTIKSSTPTLSFINSLPLALQLLKLWESPMKFQDQEIIFFFNEKKKLTLIFISSHNIKNDV